MSVSRARPTERSPRMRALSRKRASTSWLGSSDPGAGTSGGAVSVTSAPVLGGGGSLTRHPQRQTTGPAAPLTGW